MKMNRNFIQHSLNFNAWIASVVLTGLLFISVNNSAISQVTASFSSDQQYLMNYNGQYQTEFVLEANKEVFDILVSKALTMPETLTLNSKKLKKNQYRCSILYLYPTDVYYVKKTLLNLGIEQLMINSNIYSLPDYDPATK